MTAWLNKIFNVRPGEWARVVLLSLALIITNMSEAWAMNVAYAEFLKRAGLDTGLATLTWVMVLSSVLSIIALSVYSLFVDRMDNNRLFVYVILAGAVVIALSMVMVGVNLALWAFPMLYILSTALSAVWNSQFFTYLNDLFDIQSIKRTLPLILAAGRIGSAVGGFTLGFLTGHLATLEIIWVWFFATLLVALVVWVTPFFHKPGAVRREQLKPVQAASEKEPSYRESLKEGWNFTVQSGFLRWMAIGTLLLAALVTLLEYHINEVMAPEFQSSLDYAAFLGLIDGVSNVLALIILLFLLSRMTKAWGIGDTSMAFPALNFFISGALVATPYLLPAYIVAVASVAQVGRTGLRFSLQMSIESLLYNAVPIRIKGRARAFVGGVVGPFGGIAAAFLLLANLSYGWNASWLLPGLIALISLGYLVSGFAIRYQYTQALVKMLEEEDYSFLLSGEATMQLTAADPATLQRLSKKLEASATHEMRVFMTQLIAQVGGADSLSILIPAITSTAEARTQAAMLDVVSAAGLQGAKIREFYVGFLEHKNSQVRQSAAAGLEQLLGAADPWLQSLWLKMLDDRDRRLWLYALRSLAGTGSFYKFDSAVKKLEGLSASSAPDDKRSVIEVLKLMSHPQAVERLLFYLGDADDQTRVEAILAVGQLALPLGNALDEKIFNAAKALLNDPVARVRQAALKAIGKFKRNEAYQLAASALADDNAQVAGIAVDILAGAGKEIVPIAQNQLEAADFQARKMAAAVLSRINPRQFGSLIEKFVFENLNSIYRNIGLEQAFSAYDKYRGVRVLFMALRESNHSLIDQILYLLSAVHPPQILSVIGESLHSDSPETRNLALEALESLTSPQTAALIASLFEPSMGRSQLLQLGQGTLNIQQPSLLQALEELFLRDDSKAFELLALHVMGEIGAEVVAPQDGGDASEVGEKLRALLEKKADDPDPLVQRMAAGAMAKAFGLEPPATDGAELSVIEKSCILKEMPFFRNIPIAELEILSEACHEKRYAKDARVFKAGDPGGSLYLVVEGQVGIEQEKRGATTLLATLGPNSYFGEMSIFDNSRRSTSVVALEDSLLLELNRAPVFNLTMQNPELALELINILSQRIRMTSDRLADTTKSRPRELHKLFDQFQ